MASKKQIQKLSGSNARLAVLRLLEATYNTTAGMIWNKKIDEAIQ